MLTSKLVLCRVLKSGFTVCDADRRRRASPDPSPKNFPRLDPLPFRCCSSRRHEDSIALAVSRSVTTAGSYLLRRSSCCRGSSLLAGTNLCRRWCFSAVSPFQPVTLHRRTVASPATVHLPLDVESSSSGEPKLSGIHEIGRLQLQVNKLRRHKKWYKERWHRSECHMAELREEITDLRNHATRMSILNDNLTTQAKAETERAEKFFRRYWEMKHRLHEFIQQRDSINDSP